MELSKYSDESPVNPKYQEILKLDKILTKDGIPHILRRLMDGYIVIYPDDHPYRVADAIEHCGIDGREADLLEMMGLSDNPKNRNDVTGSLTAEEVARKIRKHWKEAQADGTRL